MSLYVWRVDSGNDNTSCEVGRDDAVSPGKIAAIGIAFLSSSLGGFFFTCLITPGHPFCWRLGLGLSSSRAFRLSDDVLDSC